MMGTYCLHSYSLLQNKVLHCQEWDNGTLPVFLFSTCCFGFLLYAFHRIGPSVWMSCLFHNVNVCVLLFPFLFVSCKELCQKHNFLASCQLHKTLFQHYVNILVVFVLWLLCIIIFKYQKVPCVYMRTLLDYNAPVTLLNWISFSVYHCRYACRWGHRRWMYFS